VETLGEGSRNNELFKALCAWARAHPGARREAIEKAALEWNAKHCAPPLPAEEARACAESAAKAVAQEAQREQAAFAATMVDSAPSAANLSTEQKALRAEIGRLAQLDPVEYAMTKKEMAKRLRLPVKTLDSLVLAKRYAPDRTWRHGKARWTGRRCSVRSRKHSRGTLSCPRTPQRP
jgi:hypothetical protein